MRYRTDRDDLLDKYKEGIEKVSAMMDLLPFCTGEVMQQLKQDLSDQQWKNRELDKELQNFIR